jgi:ubiquinone/menaquinone biosynthesis C-methylase UbiE
MMKRIVERELMDDEELSVAYARADFSASNQWFVDRLNATFTADIRHVVDIGCGPADVLVRLAKIRPDIQIAAVDGSAPMIRLAREAVSAAGVAKHIRLELGRIPRIALESHRFDAILSKDLLHHLPDPSVLWSEARRLGRTGTRLYVMDLHRPKSPDDANRIVNGCEGLPAVLRQDFYNSLCAAFTLEEIESQVKSAGLALRVEQVSDRHVLVTGALN